MSAEPPRPQIHKAMKYLVKDDHLRLKPSGARCLRKGMLCRHHHG